MKGTVKFFNRRHGFGFITGEDGRDVYVRYTDIDGEQKHKNLMDGDTVEYDVDEASDEKGPKAVHVKVLAEAAAQE